MVDELMGHARVLRTYGIEMDAVLTLAGLFRARANMTPGTANGGLTAIVAELLLLFELLVFGIYILFRQRV